MRTWLVLAVVVWVGCSARKQEDPVAERVHKAAVEAFPGTTVTMRADDVIVVGSFELRLENVRRSCASSEAECQEVIASLIDKLKMSANADVPLDKTRIRLTPKPRDWFEATDKGANKDEQVARQPFVGDV